MDANNILAPAGLHEAENSAVLTDLDAAEGYLEIAVRAATSGAVTSALAGCACWLRNAAATYTYNGDTENAAECLAAAGQVDAWIAAGVPSDPASLAAYQTSTLYQFHAVFGRLYGAETSREGHDGNLIFWSIFAAGFAIYGSMSYLDRRERSRR